MSDIREAMKLISGKEPSPEQVHRIQAIANSCGFALNDAMMPVLIALDSYHGAFKELPARAQQAADEIAKNSATQAKQIVDTVVAASLVPVAEKAFHDGVVRYTDILEQAAAKKSMYIVAAVGAAVLAVGLGVGYVWGDSSRGDTDHQAVMDAATAQAGVAAQIQATVAADQVVINKTAADAAAVVATANESDRWARTEQGRLAYKFFTEGGGLLAAKCQGEHWSKGKTAKGEKLCMPDNKTLFGGYSEGDTGWVVP